jgi:hypothetical protein
MGTDDTILDVDRLMKEASATTGLDDYGTAPFLEPMSRFLEAAVREAQLTSEGLAGLRMDADRWLVNRLRLQNDLTEFPEILDEYVDDPVVIVGVPRTGTTKLQRMLACDPGMQSLPFWKILNPVPFPDARPGEPDPRLLIARQFVEIMQLHHPDLLALHPFVPEEPEEEVVMLEMSCRSLSACLFFDVPTFFSWLTAQPQVPLYEELRVLLQYQQWQDGGRRGRPWVLKSPMHLGRIDALLEVFPNATIVHCHRDLHTSMTSICNLVEASRAIRSDRSDPIELGRFLLKFLSDEWSANLRQRTSLPADAQVLDVRFDQIRDDAPEVLRGIYRSRGAELSEPAESAMRGWANVNHGRSGAYRRPAEYYGLEASAVEAAFSPYLDALPDLR